MLQPWRNGRRQSARRRPSPVCTCCWGCWMPVSSGICRQRMPDAKCVARKVCVPAPACVPVGCCHLSVPCSGNVPSWSVTLTFGCISRFECQDLQSEALISQKCLTLRPVNPSYETPTQSCRAAVPWIFRALGHESSTPLGTLVPLSRTWFQFCIQMVSEPCWLILSFTEGMCRGGGEGYCPL